jgi:hypothetical protein
MKPENAEYDDWDDHPQCQTGARRVTDIEQEPEFRRELMPTEAPPEGEQDVPVQELEEPFSTPDPEAIPTQPDLGPPPGAPRAVVETYIDDLADSDDFRDTIPAPARLPEEL